MEGKHDPSLSPDHLPSLVWHYGGPSRGPFCPCHVRLGDASPSHPAFASAAPSPLSAAPSSRPTALGFKTCAREFMWWMKILTPPSTTYMFWIKWTGLLLPSLCVSSSVKWRLYRTNSLYRATEDEMSRWLSQYPATGSTVQLSVTAVIIINPTMEIPLPLQETQPQFLHETPREFPFLASFYSIVLPPRFSFLYYAVY